MNLYCLLVVCLVQKQRNKRVNLCSCKTSVLLRCSGKIKQSNPVCSVLCFCQSGNSHTFGEMKKNSYTSVTLVPLVPSWFNNMSGTCSSPAETMLHFSILVQRRLKETVCPFFFLFCQASGPGNKRCQLIAILV